MVSYFVRHPCEMMTSGERVLIWKTMGHECKRDVIMGVSACCTTVNMCVCLQGRTLPSIQHNFSFYSDLVSQILNCDILANKSDYCELLRGALSKEGLAESQEGIRTNFQP